MSTLLLALSLAPRPAAAAPPLSADLDGDGKAEVARAEPGKIKVGAASFECGYDGFTCSVSLADVNPSDGPKELILCGEAPRADRACDLYAYEKGAIRQIPVLGQAWKSLDAVQIEAPGNGFVLVKNPGRLGEHLDKYSLDAGRTGLTLVRQPFRYVNLEVVTEKSLTLSLEPAGGPVVANTKAGSKITILLESQDKPEHYLIRTSTGLVGWAALPALTAASQAVQMAYSAG